MKTSDTITNVGQGEIVTVDDTRADGDRKVTIENGGRYSVAYSADFPTSRACTIRGLAVSIRLRWTFDDGPDPKWTPMILDILCSLPHQGDLLPGGQPG